VAGPAAAQETPAPTPEATVESVATPVATAEPAPVATTTPQAVATPVPTTTPAAVATTPVPTAAPQPSPAPTPMPTQTPRPAPAAATSEAQPVSCVFPASGPCQIRASQCSILGTSGPDALIGGATADLICGLGGDDVINGAGGDDTLVGGPGDDRITGGPGADCMFGDAGDDEFPGAVDDPDIVVGNDPGPGGFTLVGIDRHARCHLPGSAGGNEGGGSNPVNAGGGAVDAPVRGGALVLDIVNAVRESEPQQTAFPVELAPDARVISGAARVLVRCTRSVGGRLVARIHGAEKPNLAGRSDFSCDPPTDVAELRLTDRARKQLADQHELELGVRIAVDGLTTRGSARVTIHAEAAK